MDTNETNNVESSVQFIKDCAESVQSKRLQTAIDALKLTEESFKVRVNERGLIKGNADYDDFKRSYNGACNLRTQLVAVGMQCSKGAYTLNYGNPNKHKGRLVGGVRQDSLLYRALQSIRLERIKAFIESKENNLLPGVVGLTEKQWVAIALAQYCVPMRHAIDGKFTTDSGKAYLKEFMDDIYSTMKANAENKEETDKLLNDPDVAANIIPLTENKKGNKGKKKTA